MKNNVGLSCDYHYKPFKTLFQCDCAFSFFGKDGRSDPAQRGHIEARFFHLTAFRIFPFWVNRRKTDERLLSVIRLLISVYSQYRAGLQGWARSVCTHSVICFAQFKLFNFLTFRKPHLFGFQDLRKTIIKIARMLKVLGYQYASWFYTEGAVRLCYV